MYMAELTLCYASSSMDTDCSQAPDVTCMKRHRPAGSARSGAWGWFFRDMEAQLPFPLICDIKWLSPWVVEKCVIFHQNCLFSYPMSVSHVQSWRVHMCVFSSVASVVWFHVSCTSYVYFSMYRSCLILCGLAGSVHSPAICSRLRVWDLVA